MNGFTFQSEIISKLEIMRIIKRFIGFVLGCLLISLFHSCSPYYAFGNAGINPIAFNKPVYSDSVKVSTYIGGKYTQTVDSAHNQFGERNYFGQLYWAQTHTEKYYSYSYGAFGYIGSYKVAKVENYNGNKSYYGGGLSGEINFNVPFQSADIRFIGLQGTLLYEDGPFTRFRRLAGEQNLISGVTSSKFAYNISCVHSIDFKIHKSTIGLDISNGITYFTNDSPRFFSSSLILHYTYKQFTAYIQNTNSLFGIGEEFALGFNYRIKTASRKVH